MTNQDRHSGAFPRWESAVHPRRRGNLPAAHRGERSGDGRYLAAYRRLLGRHQRLIRRVGIASVTLVGLVVLGCGGLWWRLSSGPIQLDVFTPWLVSAIEDNFGSRERVEVGGTQIERTAHGAAVRVRDIVVRDPDGTVVARAPKAEIDVSGLSLLSGHMRAESLNLVGAAMSVRIEPDGNVTVFAADADKRPIATANVPPAAGALIAHGAVKQGKLDASMAAPPQARLAVPRPPTDSIAAVLAWLDGISRSGLDGHDLRELGLKDGTLTVDDERTGKRFTFDNISLSLQRPRGGGMVVTVGSASAEHPWGLTASIKPTEDGSHSIALEARQISANDLLLASRFGDGSLQVDMPLSASLRGVIGPNGVPQSLTGRVVVDSGYMTESDGDDGRIDLDHAEFKINWDAGSRVLTVPFQILSGGNRVTLLGQVEAPAQSPGPWLFHVGGGTIVLNSPDQQSAPLVLNNIALNGQFDPVKKRFVVGQSEIGNSDVGVAMSGNLDYSEGSPRLAAGLAATRMSADALKRLWPVFIVPKVRDWFEQHLVSGNVDHVVIGVNSPLDDLRASGPPVPADGLTLDAQATNCVIQPVAGLPALNDADLAVHIVGRDAQISLGRATADLPSGRKLVLSSGLFEVPDTAPHAPPANVHFKLDGPVSAAVELLSMDRLRDASAVPFEPATTHGTLNALVSLAMPLKPDLPPGSTSYAIAVDAMNFSAEHMIMGQKVEAADLKVSANNQGFVLKGAVKIGGSPANLEYRQMHGDSTADVHVQGMLDQAMRNNLGLDPANAISGAIPIDIAGHVDSTSDHDGRFGVTADLTPAQIDGFLPGWVKQAGKPARATFNLTTKAQTTHIDDLLIEGAGGGVKGTIDLDGSGAVQSADFPSYGFSDGDHTSLKVNRSPDGVLHVVMRGDSYDGRGFIKAMTGGPTGPPAENRKPPDIDLEMKLGAVLGFNGEALRGLDLKLSRRSGEIKSLTLASRIGSDGSLTGDLRGPRGGRQVIDLESSDAGALFRFADIYSRMDGGQMSTVMGPPSANNPIQAGQLSVRNFTVHDESQLQRAVSNGSPLPRNNMFFSGLKVDFTRSPGRVALHDGVVRGPVLGGTIDGLIDYASENMDLRGTLIPLYGANNLLGQLPVVGLFLGGEKEGLVGVTYEVVGRPGNPVLHVNPLSALAPGLLRKVFEFPANSGNQAVPVPPPSADDSTGAVDATIGNNH
ncbi:MAG TPA: DUF3971 domain-containing protein [Xanthobacteraceae bacterium]|jgi:hypothetical protein|nr:DUF3971 domain-containing protein [Xanthobacteraceae bacterium]